VNVARPALVVTVPARRPDEARLQVEAAKSAGANVVEIRLDRWSPSDRARAAELFPSPLPLLGTLRSQIEGGEGPDGVDDRAAELSQIALAPFAYIDVEADRDHRSELLLMQEGRKVVRSSHLPDSASLESIRERLADPPPSGGIVKVVVRASLTDALERLLPLAGSLPSADRPVFLTIGASGGLWRAWTRELGGPWVFAALPESHHLAPVEPSQVPVDRLSAFLGDPGAPIFAVVGHPVQHSRSPAIHHGWMRRDERAGVYVTLDITTPAEFRLAVESLPAHHVVGLNVTHPWKELARDCASARSEAVEATGVANCLTFREGKVSADNTDLGAMARRLTELRRAEMWDGTALTVLGSGGAARATLAAARQLGCRAFVRARRESEAGRLAREFGAEAESGPPERPVKLLIQATSVGRDAVSALELPWHPLLSSETYVLDWVYDALEPTLARAARDAGARYEDGRRLLVYQAAESYARWWGAPPAPESLDRTLREVGCEA
jgi:shikimate dehydrogenase